MAKSLQLILLLYAFATFANSFDQPGTNDPNTITPDISFNNIDSPVRDIAWCSEQKNIIFLLSERLTLYRSVDGGSAFEKLGKNELIGAQDDVGQVEKFIQSPVDKNMLILYGPLFSWVTSDCGATYQVLANGRRADEFQFHPTERTWVLASAWTKCEDFPAAPCREYKELFLTKNLGGYWETVVSNVFQFSWAQISGNPFLAIPNERIMIAHDPEGFNYWSEKAQVSYSDDFFKTTVPLVKGGSKFLITNDFIFVVYAEQSDTDEVTLLVGDPRMGVYNLRPIELPVKRLMKHSYTILETTEHSVFLHINHEGEKSRYGNVYVSDSTGVGYSLALTDNIRNPDGQCDFERVQGLESVYLSNVYDKNAIKRLDTDLLANFKKTMISFDKGGIWQSLIPPEADSEGRRIVCISEEDCSLHLHSISNPSFGPFYTTENSPGLILGTGNVGRYLSNNTDEINTYLSRDGGLNWFEMAKGSHIYEVSGHGSLLLMASNQQATTTILYSWNQGLSWDTLKISDVEVVIQNITTEPSNSANAEKFLIYGRAMDATGSGVIMAVDFAPLNQRLCKGFEQPDTPDSDYETWNPRAKTSSNCVMGREAIYIRRKRESECFSGEPYGQWKTIKTCECTEEDWQCDYGFMRIPNGPCVPVDEFDTTMIAPKECMTFYQVTSGYRKIEGNICDRGVNHSPLRLACPEVETEGVLASIARALGFTW